MWIKVQIFLQGSPGSVAAGGNHLPRVGFWCQNPWYSAAVECVQNQGRSHSKQASKRQTSSFSPADCCKAQSWNDMQKKRKLWQNRVPTDRGKGNFYYTRDFQSKRGKDMICIWFRDDKSSEDVTYFRRWHFSSTYLSFPPWRGWSCFIKYSFLVPTKGFVLYEEEMNLEVWSECVLRALVSCFRKICCFVFFFWVRSFRYRIVCQIYFVKSFRVGITICLNSKGDGKMLRNILFVKLVPRRASFF